MTTGTILNYNFSNHCIDDNIVGAADVVLTVEPSLGRVRFQLDVPSPWGYIFCWDRDLVFLQGSEQIEVSTADTPTTATLTMEGNSSTCPVNKLLPGVQVRGSVDDFPASFNLSQPFVVFVNHVAGCQPLHCGVCEFEL
jgi:hypothetical protein